jgi:hypothetical protein
VTRFDCRSQVADHGSGQTIHSNQILCVGRAHQLSESRKVSMGRKSWCVAAVGHKKSFAGLGVEPPVVAIASPLAGVCGVVPAGKVGSGSGHCRAPLLVLIGCRRLGKTMLGGEGPPTRSLHLADPHRATRRRGARRTWVSRYVPVTHGDGPVSRRDSGSY